MVTAAVVTLGGWGPSMFCAVLDAWDWSHLTYFDALQHKLEE